VQKMVAYNSAMKMLVAKVCQFCNGNKRGEINFHALESN
jgi:hypothetical protein